MLLIDWGTDKLRTNRNVIAIVVIIVIFIQFCKHVCMYVHQGPKLRLTGRQCDQKLSVDDQSSKSGRQQVIILLSPRHLKFQGKKAFLKRKQKTPAHGQL